MYHPLARSCNRLLNFFEGNVLGVAATVGVAGVATAKSSTSGVEALVGARLSLGRTASLLIHLLEEVAQLGRCSINGIDVLSLVGFAQFVE